MSKRIVVSLAAVALFSLVSLAVAAEPPAVPASQEAFLASLEPSTAEPAAPAPSAVTSEPAPLFMACTYSCRPCSGVSRYKFCSTCNGVTSCGACGLNCPI